MPLHDLQVGVEGGVVDGGGGLADAAAHLVGGLAAHIGGGGEIALVGGAAAGGVVVGEDLPGQQDDTVAHRGGQLHVALPIGGAGHAGAGLSQHIPEEELLQALGGDGGLRDGEGHRHRAAPGGPLQGGLGIGDLEVQAGDAGGDLKGLLVQGGVLYLGVDLVVDGLHVHRLGVGGDGGEDQGLLAVGGKSGEDLPLHVGEVEGPAGGAHVEDELVVQHLPGGLLDPAAQLRFDPGQQGVHLGLPLRGVAQGDVQVVAAQQGLEQPPAPGQEAALAQAPGGVVDGAGVGLHHGAADGVGLVQPVDPELHGLPGVALVQLLLQAVLHLVPGEAAQLHAGGGDPGQGGAAGPHPGAQPQVAGGQHRHQHGGGDEAPPALFGAGLRLGQPLTGLFLFHDGCLQILSRAVGPAVVSVDGAGRPALSAVNHDTLYVPAGKKAITERLHRPRRRPAPLYFFFRSLYDVG